jgi:hypothetical protein
MRSRSLRLWRTKYNAARDAILVKELHLRKQNKAQSKKKRRSRFISTKISMCTYCANYHLQNILNKCTKHYLCQIKSSNSI